ncbi:MAG: Smr/MutS family protein [Alphaproteobacteria bacterium]|nr:Smr/MutS family protein [Alphaproteobacteria bacterium]
MSRSHRLTPADLNLWRQVAETVTPLSRRGHEREEMAVPPPPVESSAPAAPEPAPPPQRLAPVSKPLHRPPPAPLDPGTIAGVDRRTGERLRRGELSIDGRLDLHGLRQEEAHAALDRFLAASQATGRRCVLVITGKGFRDGAGVLKDRVPDWLNLPPNRARILAIMPARPHHGGGGALYVLLKRLR